MTARQIADLVSRHHFDRHRQVVIPNLATYVVGEADLVSLYPSGWMHEVEIKISKSDFRREFVKKASKHRFLLEGTERHAWDGRKWAVLGQQPHCIRQFWFAMPSELARALLAEIPGHAGLIAVDPGHRWNPCEVLIKAPVLKMARKLTNAERTDVLRLAYVRYWDIRAQLTQEQQDRFIEATQVAG